MSNNQPTPIEPLVLDVRAILNQGGSPCEPIEQAVASLKPGQIFILLAPFEPVPLYAKLGREGFAHFEQRLPDGTWRIEFQKELSSAALGKKPARKESSDIHLDNRGLEPPEPMVRTLEALDGLASGAKLIMRSDRKPLHLFKELETRGFTFDCTEQMDHSFVTNIWHAAGG